MTGRSMSKSEITIKATLPAPNGGKDHGCQCEWRVPCTNHFGYKRTADRPIQAKWDF